MKRVVWITLLFLLVLWGVSAQEKGIVSERDITEDGHVPQEISWTAVKNASLYQCVIKLGDKVFYEKSTKDTSLRCFLPPGEYTYIINVFNKFSKISSSTEVRKLTVLKRLKPVISLMPERIIRYPGKDEIFFEFGAVDFQPGGEIFLLDSEGNEIEGTFYPLVKNLYEARFPGELFNQPGIYSLKVVNPTGLLDVEKHILDIKISENPVLNSVSFPKNIKRSPYFGMIAKGSGFEKGVKLRFRNRQQPFYYEATGVILTPHGDLKFNIDLSSAILGSYHIEVENPSGKKAILENVTKVTRSGRSESVETTGTLAEQLWKWAQKDEGVFLGYSPSLLFLSNNELEDQFGGSLVGFDFVFRNGFVENPEILAFGFEAWLKYAYFYGYFNQNNYSVAGTVKDAANLSYHNFMIDFYLFWKFSIPVVSITLRMGTGWTFGMVEGDVAMIPSVQKNLMPSLLCGGGLSTVIASRLAIELGTNLRVLYYGTVYFEPYLIFGYLLE